MSFFFSFFCPVSFAERRAQQKTEFQEYLIRYERSQKQRLYWKEASVCCISVNRRETHSILLLALVSPSTLFVDITSAEGAHRLLHNFCSSLVQRNR